MNISPELPAREVKVRITRIDPFKDMIYAVTVTDRVGNQTVIRDTIGGFTLKVEDAYAQQLGFRVDRPLDYGELTLTEERCDTVYLENYGIRPLELRRPRVVGNLQYSIPPEQLPIVLLPGERLQGGRLRMGLDGRATDRRILRIGLGAASGGRQGCESQAEGHEV